MVEEDIETRMLKLFSKYVGKSVSDVENVLGEHLNPESKSYCNMLSNRILQSDPQLYLKLRSQDITVKTVRVTKNKPPKESMSFPAFHFNDIVQQDWDTSDFKKQLSSRFFFVVFNILNEGDHNKLILWNAGFWSIPSADLNRISFVWEDTKKKIEEGTYDGFLSKTKNPFAHVRPHGANASKTEEFRGKQVKMFSFWLNNNYIYEIINGLPILNSKDYEMPSEDDTIGGRIIKILSESTNPMPSFRLKQKVAESFPELEGYNETVSKLVQDKIIENTVLGYRLKEYKLGDMLRNAPDLIKQYFDCESPGDLAESLHRSLEDVEMEVRSFFTVRPEEDGYVEDFSKYQFTARQFTLLYDVSPTVYRYLSLMHPKGWKSPSELMDAPSKTDTFKERLQRMMFNKMELDGTVIELNELGILSHILSNIKNDVTMSELARRYKEFAKKYGVTTKDISTITASRIKIISETEDNFVLKTGANSVKYFPHNKSEVYDLFTKMNLESYKDMYVAAELLRTDNRELMDQYGLKTENDVFFLFAKYKNCKILKANRVTLPGQPSIRFGNGDIKSQLKNLLSETGRITKNDFCSLYSQRYGVKEMTVRVYMSSFPEYANGDYYDLNPPLLGDDVIESLKCRFKSAVIPLSEAKEHFLIAEKKYGIALSNDTDLYFHIQNLSRLGYKMSQGAIFLDKYDSLSDCIASEYLDRDFITVDRELDDISSFKKMLNERIEYGDFFAIGHNEYISAKKLYSTGVTPEMIDDYVENASTYFPEGTYFTFRYLHKKGFDHPLEEQGFEDDFYENLLQNCVNISKNDIGKCKVFVYGEEFSRNKAVIQMVYEALGDEGSEYAYDIAETVKNEYGLDISSELKKDHKPLRYNSDAEKVYRDDMTFIEEITRA